MKRPAAAIGLAALPIVVILGVLLLVVLPLGTYFSQQNEMRSVASRASMLRERNSALNTRIKTLETDEEVIRLARSQFRMVKEGERLFIVSGLRSDDNKGVPSATDPLVAPLPPQKATSKVGVAKALVNVVAFWE